MVGSPKRIQVRRASLSLTADFARMTASPSVIDRVVNMKPWRIRLPRRGTAGVLELPAGTLDASGTTLGDRIELSTAVA